MAKKSKYIVRVTVLTRLRLSKKAVREAVQDCLDDMIAVPPFDTAKASTVDEQ